MEHLKRNITITLFVAAAGLIGFVLFYTPPAPQKQNNILPGEPLQYTYSSEDISFTYPAFLTLDTKDSIVSLHHEIPYENNGACDMVGEWVLHKNLTDFHVTIRIASTSLVHTVQQMSPYIPEENFDGDVLKVNPGFIDAFEIGALKGFMIYEGAEGCGMTTYYFPVSNNRTLMIQKESIQALSGVRGQEEIQRILKIPGSIAPSVSNKIFEEIITSLIIK